MSADAFTWNGLRMQDSETITCNECGTALKTIEESHLQGSNCTGGQGDCPEA
jgi:hypothetical protein